MMNCVIKVFDDGVFLLWCECYVMDVVVGDGG